MAQIRIPVEAELLTGESLHSRVILDAVMNARSFVWIATANLKDMHISRGRSYRPILETFDEMARRGVRFRIVHGELPSRPFRNTLERLPNLTSGGLELQVCPRSHWKMVIVDEAGAYLGSANFTGAGLGAKSGSRRNLEIGVWAKGPEWVSSLQALFDDFWMGESCEGCSFKANCPDPIRP